MDKKVKKKVLQEIPYGAYIVGTRTDDAKDWLMFGTWLMQTSFKPTLVAFAFRKDSRTLANVQRQKGFAVSFLQEGMQDVAGRVLEGSFEKGKTQGVKDQERKKRHNHEDDGIRGSESGGTGPGWGKNHTRGGLQDRCHHDDRRPDPRNAREKKEPGPRHKAGLQLGQRDRQEDM